MTSKLAEFPKMAKAGAAFFICWLAGFGASYFILYLPFRWPNSRLIVFVLNEIFFYNQKALPDSFSTVGDHAEVLSGWPAIICGVIFWIGVGFAFAWFTRRLRMYFTLPLAAISIFAILIAMQWLLYLLGIQIDFTSL